MARTIRMGSGSVRIEMPDHLAAIVERVLSSGTNRRLVRLVAEAVEELRRDAHAKWPVSGRKRRRRRRSRDALRAAARFVPPDQIVGSVYVDPNTEAHHYAYFIRSAKVIRWHSKGSPVVGLLQRPGRRRAKALARELAAIIADAARGGP